MRIDLSKYLKSRFGQFKMILRSGHVLEKFGG